MGLRRVIVGVLVCSSVAVTVGGSFERAGAVTTTIDIAGPVGSGKFGERVTVLTNGNFVVIDSMFDSVSQPDVGAVYLYDGMTNQLISTLQGSSANDLVGSGGITTISDTGNFLVRSPNWDNGAAINAGAITWVNGITGLSGAVGPANSLVGSTLNDQVGSGSITTLTANKNFVITTTQWDNGALVDAGAITWGNTNTGVSGAINAGNSQVGTTASEGLSSGITTLGNGNYVIRRPFWDNGAVVDVGAVTLANGTTGFVGALTAANSLHGTAILDNVGTGVTALAGNSNYVVRSPIWNNGATADVGAVTWADGSAGLVGTVNPGNSLIGVAVADNVGSGVTALTNGNYVVRSPLWNNGAVADAGAVTWRIGTGPSAGTVVAANSIVGSTAFDQVGAGLGALQVNGNYVVRSPNWDNGANFDAGAVTFGNGATGTTGVVSAANSLVGTHPNDFVSNVGVLGLANGNYAVFSPSWNNGAILTAGAVTWGSGTVGVLGAVSAANSIVGAVTNDAAGSGTGGSFTNSNYLVLTPTWDNGAATDAGAVTFVNGTTGRSGVIAPTNSLVGTTANDAVGTFSLAFLANGNYAVGSPSWDNGAIVDAGAVTWANGVTGGSGPVTVANSVVGLKANDRIGALVTGLADSNFVVASPMWDNGAIVDAGAVTWMNGTAPTTGSVTSGNSLVGTKAADQLGSFGVGSLADGDYIVFSAMWDNGAIADAGAITYGDAGGLVGQISSTNSVLGGAAGGGATLVASFTFTTAGAMVTGRPNENIVTLLVVPFKPNFTALAPARLADTRPGAPTVDGVGSGGGPLAAGSTLEVVVAGRGGVFASAVAVGLNVTAVDGAAFGFVTVFPCGSTRPTASSLNFTVGSIVPNAVFAKIGTGGKVCVFVSQPTNIIVDVNGFFPTTSSFKSLNPQRVLDTRPGEPTADGQQQGTGPVGNASVVEVLVGGRVGVPLNASTVALNVTITGPALPGFATVFPCGSPRPTASSLNYVAGLTVANLVVSKVGTGGKVCIFVQTATDVIVDVNGYFPVVSSYTAVNPARLLDTRPGQVTIDGQFNGLGRQAAGATVTLTVAGRGGVPPDATVVMLNVTATEATVGGFVTVFPCGIPLPLASNLNYAVGQTVPNAVIVKVGAGGAVCLFTSQPSQLIADITGYIAT